MPQTRRPFHVLILGLVLSTALGRAASGAPRPHAPPTLPRFATATETTLYAFQGGSDGALSYAPLIADSHGALYGTTIHGGIPSSGYGTVFKLTPSGSGYSESVLYAFQGGYDGSYPFAGVIADNHGALYGTTYTGGPSGGGSVYKLTRSHSGYTKTILYGFMGGSDGATPLGTLYMDHGGNLFGTTTNGGTAGTGVVFELTPGASSTYTFRVIHGFQGGNDAANPQYGALVADANGALYGTTSNGGSPQNWGAVYKLTPSGSTYQESVICSFPYPNGSHPFGGLKIDAGGALYGTTTLGGPSNAGTVFKLIPSGSGYIQNVLYTFQAASTYDGAAPQADVLIDATGSLYGTTQYGGTAGVGTVFKLRPFVSPTSVGPPGNDAGAPYVETVLHSFQGGSDGKNPEAGLIQRNGVLYSTTFFGGGPGNGTVFSITP